MALPSEMGVEVGEGVEEVKRGEVESSLSLKFQQGSSKRGSILRSDTARDSSRVVSAITHAV